MKYILGVDVGSQSARVHVYNEHAQLVCQKSADLTMNTPKPLWATQDASLWWRIITRCIRGILQETEIAAKNIVSVGCCAHMHGTVPVGHDGSLLQKDIQMYLDKRTMDIAERLEKQADEKSYQLAGNLPATPWFGLKIRWTKEHQPKLYEQTKCFLTPKDYINYLLTGEFCTDPSEASASYAMDVNTGAWSPYLLDVVGIDIEKLPPIQESHKKMGAVSKQAAEQTGLAEGTPVVTGCGDMLAGMFVAGLGKPGVCVDLAATTGIMAGHADQSIRDRRLMNARSVHKGWTVYGVLDGAGAGFRWLREDIAKKETADAKRVGQDPYDALSELAAPIPAGANGLFFLPYLMGERTNRDMQGAYVGLNLNMGIPELVRAFLEGVTYEMKRIMGALENNGMRMDAVYHVAGGSKGRLWNQIKADIYQKPVHTLTEDEGSVLGAALLGGIAAGLFESVEEAADAVFGVKETFEPNLKKKEIYAEGYGLFNEMYDQLRPTLSSIKQRMNV